MNFPKTPDKVGLAFSPWEIRPGTSVNVAYSYVDKHEWEWDSNSPFDNVVTGTPYTTSVKCDYPINVDDITITNSGIYIEALGRGPVGLTIYSKREVSQNITAVPAIDEDSTTYYDDWFYDETGMAVPMTIVPLSLELSEQTYKPEDFTVDYDQPEKGISILNGEVWTSDSTGTVKMIDQTDDFSMSRNLFRKGITEVAVPLECKIEPVLRYIYLNGVKYQKVVEVDLQEWIDDTKLDVRGILWHRDYLYSLTDTGMHRFNRWGNFDIPDDSYSNVMGTDLTYTVDDKFLVSDEHTVKIYKVRHDYLHYDKDSEFIRHREENPEYRID